MAVLREAFIDIPKYIFASHRRAVEFFFSFCTRVDPVIAASRDPVTIPAAIYSSVLFHRAVSFSEERLNLPSKLQKFGAIHNETHRWSKENQNEVGVLVFAHEVKLHFWTEYRCANANTGAALPPTYFSWLLGH